MRACGAPCSRARSRRAWRSRSRSACRCPSLRRSSPAISCWCSWLLAEVDCGAVRPLAFCISVWGCYCNYRATRAIGTNLVAPVQQFNLIITLAMALWLLGEYLTPLKIFGIGADPRSGRRFTMQTKQAPRRVSAPSPTRRSRRSMPRSRRRSSRNMPRATRSRCSAGDRLWA